MRRKPLSLLTVRWILTHICTPIRGTAGENECISDVCSTEYAIWPHYVDSIQPPKTPFPYLYSFIFHVKLFFAFVYSKS